MTMRENTGTKRLFIVDHAPEALQLLKVAFQVSMNCTVTATLCVSQAIAYIRTLKMDLIVADFEMPAKGAMAVAKALITAQPSTPLIFFAKTDLPHEIRVENLIFPVIRKPNVDELLNSACNMTGWSRKASETEIAARMTYLLDDLSKNIRRTEFQRIGTSGRARFPRGCFGPDG